MKSKCKILKGDVVLNIIKNLMKDHKNVQVLPKLSDENEWSVLYHYTSLNNFERIIKEGYLGMADIVKSNDPAEGIFALDALEKAYKRMSCQKLIRPKECDRFRKIYIEFINDEKYSSRLQQVVLASSFCEPNLPLALWRSYGDNGRGVAMGVAKGVLNAIGEKENFIFRKIEYLTEEEMINRAISFWLLNKNRTDYEIREEIFKFYIDGYFFKRAENSYENEWRLIYTGIKLDQYELLPSNVPKEIDMYMREDDMVIFYKLDIRNNPLIEQIYLGPQCKVSSSEMKLFLSKYKVQHNGVMTDGTVMR